MHNINLYLFNIYSILFHFDLHNFIIFNTYFLCYFLLRFSSKFHNLVKAANPHLVMYILNIAYHCSCLYPIIQLKCQIQKIFLVLNCMYYRRNVLSNLKIYLSTECIPRRIHRQKHLLKAWKLLRWYWKQISDCQIPARTWWNWIYSM